MHVGTKFALMLIGLLALAGLVSVAAITGQAHADHGTPDAAQSAPETTEIYLEIENQGDSDDALISVLTPVAGSAQFVQVDSDQHTATTSSVALPVEESVSLTPNGQHIVLHDLNQELVPGILIPVTFVFEHAGEIELDVPLYAPGTATEDVEASEPVAVDALVISTVWASPGTNSYSDHTGGTAETDHEADMNMPGTPATALSTGAVYMTVTNSRTETDKLVAATTSVAKQVEIHEAVDNQGVMEMRPFADGVAFEPGQTIQFEPGGYHLMLIGLQHDLLPGETFPVTLTFANAGDLTIEVVITLGNEMPTAEVAPPVSLEGITVSDAWSRAAPAMN